MSRVYGKTQGYDNLTLKMANNTLQRIKAQVGKVNWSELYTLCLIVFGLPAIVWLWADWRLALTVFVVVNIALGIVNQRGRE